MHCGGFEDNAVLPYEQILEVCADSAFSRSVGDSDSLHTSWHASSNIPDLVSMASPAKECRRYSFSATCENITLARRVGAMAAAEAAEGAVEETSVRISFSIPWQCERKL